MDKVRKIKPGGMNYIRKKVLNREIMVGTWLNLGSSLTAEIAGKTGFDWVLVDLEHGFGDYESLVHQLQALSGTSTASIVRIAWNEPFRFKRVLDLGPSGIMVPYVNTEAEAKQSAMSMRYPPQGIRGVAKLNRASNFGREFDQYFTNANDNLLTIVQIETSEAVQNVFEIAKVDGVDVLFVGPLDLSVNLGIPQKTNHPKFRKALERVADACSKSGKASGILLSSSEEIKQAVEIGFTFFALGSDGRIIVEGMKQILSTFEKYRKV